MRKVLPALLLLFVVFSSCKKDPYFNSPLQPQQSEAVNLISTDALKGWFAANAVGNYVKPDWSKAQQKNVNGVSIVKVPIKNLYNAGLSEVKKQSLSKGFNSAGSVDTLNFFNPNHPPMLFFIKDNKASDSDSVKALMMNFIPSNPNIENGKDNIWTGTLIEWNMRDEKVLFQTLKKSYVEHVGSITQNQMSDYQNAALNKGETKYKPMNFLRDIWDAIKWVVEAVGYFFGVPGDYNYFYQGRLDGCDFLWGALCGGGGSNSGYSGSSSGWYNGFGSVYDGVYSGYINGYNGFINDGWNGYNGDDMDQDEPCPPASGGMSISNHQTLGAISSNGCPIYKPVPTPTPAALLILTLAITDVGKSSFLHSNAAISMVLNNYLQTNGITPETIDFTNWAVDYLMANPGVGLEIFKNQYLSITEGTEEGEASEYDESFWNSPSLTFPNQNLPTFQSFKDAYPKHADNLYNTPAKLYAAIGGRIGQLYQDHPAQNANTCAARLSRALNYSGITIPHIINAGKEITFKGADNKYYFMGAASMISWMKKTFGVPSGGNHINSTQAGKWGQSVGLFIASKKGIYAMLPNDTSRSTGFDATGHVDLMDGTCDGGCYFNAKGGIKDIFIWELQ